MKLALFVILLSLMYSVLPESESSVITIGPKLSEVSCDTLKPIRPDGKYLVVDTIAVFDRKTYEETIKIKTYYVPQKEYLAIQRKKKRKAQRRARKNFIDVRDTCIVFNPKTYEETVTVSTRKFTKKEYRQFLRSQRDE